MSLVGPTADQQAGQTAAVNKNLSEFGARGGRRTLMLGDQPLNAETSLNQSLLSLRASAPDKITNIGQILAQLGLGETSAATAAGGSAISGALGAANLANDSATATTAGYKTVGNSIGQILLQLKGILSPPATADAHATPSVPSSTPTASVPIFGV